MIPASRTYLLLLLSTAIALVASLSVSNPQLPGFSYLVLLGCDGLILLLAFIDSQRVVPIQVQRHFGDRLSINRNNPIQLTLTSGQQSAHVHLRDTYPPIFPVSTSVLIATLPKDSQQTLSYSIRPDQRGQFSWGNIYVRQLSPWGLSWRSWQVPQAIQAIVYPDLIGLKELSIRLTLQSSGNLQQRRRMGTGTEFAELRDYGAGDDLRFVDWKATARRGHPLVRVLEPEREQTVIVLLDRGRLMTANVEGLSRFDWALKTTLSVAMAALHRGDQVGVGVFDRQIHTWIAPERGIKHLSRLIDRLSPIQPVLLESDYFGVASTLVSRQVRRALVVMVTDLIDTTASVELLAAMNRLSPRYLPFCVALRDPEVDRIAHTDHPTLNDAYSRAVALDLLAQRQLAFATLKHQGSLVLDAPANHISEELVNQYLDLKARGRL